MKSHANLRYDYENSQLLIASLRKSGDHRAADDHQKAIDRWAEEFREELTAAGLQLVIPGCERVAPDNGKPFQPSLFA